MILKDEQIVGIDELPSVNKDNCNLFLECKNCNAYQDFIHSNIKTDIDLLEELLKCPYEKNNKFTYGDVIAERINEIIDEGDKSYVLMNSIYIKIPDHKITANDLFDLFGFFTHGFMSTIHQSYTKLLDHNKNNE